MAFALSAGIGALGSLASGFLGMSGSQSAAKAQEQGSMNAIDFAANMLGINSNNLDPFLWAGGGARDQLSKLLGGNTAEMQQTLQNLPGFQFQSQWGTKTAQNALAAEGLGGSTGPLAKAISDYNNGLAGTYYGNYVNQEQNLANMGLSAGQTIAGAVNNTAGIGATASTNAGNAGAAGILGGTNALSGGITGAAGSGSNALLLQALLSNQNNGTFFNNGNGMSGFDVGGIFNSLGDNAFG